jgi:ribose 5-phosphate isomerase A
MTSDHEKGLAAAAAADMVKHGMRVGLGTGSTVAFLLRALAARDAKVTYVATSPRTEDAARALGLDVEAFENVDELDLAIDGADQISREGWLIKGGGGAHTREKIVASAAEYFVVIADSTKLVETLHAPVPLELVNFGLAATMRHLQPVSLRDGPPSPDGGRLADYHGDPSKPAILSGRLDATAGIVAHGLFAPTLVSRLLVGVGDIVRSSSPGAVS